jgi:hypothetical protein
MKADNTFRTLKGEEPFVERWQCRIGLHRWLKWSELDKKGGNLYAYQKRYCADCNECQTRKLRWDF